MASRGLSTDALTAITEFLHGAIELILHSRRVYPPEIFEQRRLFDVALPHSRAPELNEYIAYLVHGARELMERGECDALVVSILGRPRDAFPSVQPTLLERFRIDLRLPPFDSNAVGPDGDALRGSLRGFLLKLHVCDALLAPLPDADLSFAAELHTRSTSSSAPLPAVLREKWCETDVTKEELDDARGAARGGPPGGNLPMGDAVGTGFPHGAPEPYVLPLKSLDMGGIAMGLSVAAATPPPKR